MRWYQIVRDKTSSYEARFNSLENSSFRQQSTSIKEIVTMGLSPTCTYFDRSILFEIFRYSGRQLMPKMTHGSHVG